MGFREKLEHNWNNGKFVCVGLDSELGKIPKSAHAFDFEAAGPMPIDVPKTIINFNRNIIGATRDIAGAYKINFAFYLSHGVMGIIALKETFHMLRAIAPDALLILDAKFADIDNTNFGYVQFAFDLADAVTVSPYLGGEALKPFLERKDKGVIVLAKTSNKGSDEFQGCNKNLLTREPEVTEELHRFEARIGRQLFNDVPTYAYVAFRVAEYWNKNDNCALVVGATYPEELAYVRQIVGDMPILIPGIGAQGGDVAKTVSAGKDSRGKGMIINSSRGIIFASSAPDFAEVARTKTLELHNSINESLQGGIHA